MEKKNDEAISIKNDNYPRGSYQIPRDTYRKEIAKAVQNGLKNNRDKQPENKI